MIKNGYIPEIRQTDKASNEVSSVPKKRVLRWMESTDIKKLGELYVLLSKERFVRRITPQLTFEEGHRFCLFYLHRIFLDNHQDEWIGGRYEAGWNLAALFMSYWNKKNVPANGVNDVKQLLADLLLTGDAKVRVCVVTAVLEHLFEKPKIRDYFRDWIELASLKDAYKEAAEYADKIKHGSLEKE